MSIAKGHYRVIFIGPFYTGFFMDTAILFNHGYVNFQRDITKRLREDKNEEWFIEEDKKGDVVWATEFENIYGGTPIIPPSLVGKNIDLSLTYRKSDDKENKETKNKWILDESSEGNGISVKINRVKLFYHDYGTGTFRINTELNLPHDIEVKQYRELIEEFSGEINGFFLNSILEENTKSLMEVIQTIETNFMGEKDISFPQKITGLFKRNKEDLSRDILDSFEDMGEEITTKGLKNISIQTGLWFHRVFIFELDSEEPISDDDYKCYRDVLYSSQKMGPQNCSLDEYVRVYPSFNFSLFLYNKNNKPKDIQLNRLMEIAEYYYAATSLLDIILFNKLIEFKERKNYSPRIRELKEELEDLQQISDQLELFLLTLKNSIINLSPNSRLMWRNIDTEWYYNSMLETLEEKNALIVSKVDSKLEELNQKRSETLNKFIKIFTLIAIIGPLLEAYLLLQDLGIIDAIISNLSLFLLVSIPISSIFLLIIVWYLRKLLTEY